MQEKTISERILDELPQRRTKYPDALRLEDEVLDRLIYTYSTLYFSRNFEPTVVAALCMIPSNLQSLIRDWNSL